MITVIIGVILDLVCYVRRAIVAKFWRRYRSDLQHNDRDVGNYLLSYCGKIEMTSYLQTWLNG